MKSILIILCVDFCKANYFDRHYKPQTTPAFRWESPIHFKPRDFSTQVDGWLRNYNAENTFNKIFDTTVVGRGYDFGMLSFFFCTWVKGPLINSLQRTLAQQVGIQCFLGAISFQPHNQTMMFLVQIVELWGQNWLSL